MGLIILSPSGLLHDYFAVGGAGATLVNAGLCGMICCFLLKIFKINITGPFIAAVYTVIGFAFFGKNIINIWPILFGVGIYTKVQGVPYKNFALVALFGTTLAPLFSTIAFASFLNGWWAIAFGCIVGLGAGIVLPPLASHMLRFHDGYNIYNIGFTGGMIGSFSTALLRSFGFTIEPTSLLTDEYDFLMKFFFITFFSMMIAGGLVLAHRSDANLGDSIRKIFASSGRLVSDFTRIGDYPSTIINMGVMGLVSTLFVFLLGGAFNGPVIGGILTVVGFAAFGKHPKNCIPILLGVYIASLLKVWETGSTGVIIAGLFGTTLAPIAGQYGLFSGVLAGALHLSIVMNVGVLHGGINLYNNGFAGGFVAATLVPVIDAFVGEKKNET